MQILRAAVHGLQEEDIVRQTLAWSSRRKLRY